MGSTVDMRFTVGMGCTMDGPMEITWCSSLDQLVSFGKRVNHGYGVDHGYGSIMRMFSMEGCIGKH